MYFVYRSKLTVLGLSVIRVGSSNGKSVTLWRKRIYTARRSSST